MLILKKTKQKSITCQLCSEFWGRRNILFEHIHLLSVHYLLIKVYKKNGADFKLKDKKKTALVGKCWLRNLCVGKYIIVACRGNRQAVFSTNF